MSKTRKESLSLNFGSLRRCYIHPRFNSALNSFPLNELRWCNKLFRDLRSLTACR